MSLFESYADSGILQFTPESIGYTYHSKQTVSTLHQVYDVGGPTSAVLVYGGCVTTTQLTGFNDFLAVSVTTTNTPCICIRSGDSVQVATKDPASVDVYFFTAYSQSVGPNDTHSGLQLFDDQQFVTYDSYFTPMKVGAKQMSPNIANGASTAVSLTSGRTYAYGHIGSLRRNSSAYNPPAPYTSLDWNQPYTVPGCRRTAAHTCQIEPLTIGQPAFGWWGSLFPPSSVSPTATAGGILCVDVTGLSTSNIPSRSVSISPTSWTNTSLAGAGPHDQVFTATASGGTATSYSWEIVNNNTPGSLAFINQTGNQITLRCNPAPFFPLLSAAIRCTVVIDGVKRSSPYVSVYLGRGS